MPDARLERTRDRYVGWIDEAILAKGLRYLGNGRVAGIINGEWRVRVLSDRDTRWLTVAEQAHDA